MQDYLERHRTHPPSAGQRGTRKGACCLPNQIDEAAHYSRSVAAAGREQQWRPRLWRAVQSAIDHPVHLHPLQRCRHDRDAKTGGDQIEGRDDARRLLADQRAEPGGVAGGEDRIV